ncbi:hypothetical protein ACIBG8_48200 [Nonomuraea sp. NPDC050556]|uniref:hypothetical protein n=1 Tax=Nonomuraea sp. NPDC050556 TaxID=3364369 RepID=UPI0037BB51AB
MPKRLAIAALALLTACAAPAQPPAQQQKGRAQQMESVKADCMKRKGFKYVAYVAPMRINDTEDDKRRRAGDYQAMLKFRQKRGFGVFDKFVYPELDKSSLFPANPNDKIMARLSDDQADAYLNAKDACFTLAAKQVLGKTVRSEADYLQQMNRRGEQLEAGRLDTDPLLIELAARTADCLRAKGYSIARSNPSSLPYRGLFAFLKERNAIGRSQQKEPRNNELSYRPSLTPKEARPYLDREIAAALDDLECGTDFYAAYNPRGVEIDRQIDEEFGMSSD